MFERIEVRLMMAAHIASGLVATHGIDHGGVSPSVVAGKALAIADEIISAAINDGGSSVTFSGELPTEAAVLEPATATTELPPAAPNK